MSLTETTSPLSRHGIVRRKCIPFSPAILTDKCGSGKDGKISIRVGFFMKLSKGFIFSLFTSLCWAVSIVLTRTVLQSGENPYNLTVWTTSLAFPYWASLAYKERSNFLKLTVKDWIILTGMALISSVGVSYAEVFALTYSPAVNFSFLIRMVTVFIILLAAVFLNERITKKKIILLLTILAGSYLLITNGRPLLLTSGDGFTLLEAFLIAIGNGVLIKLVTNRMHPDTGSSGKYFLALLPIIIISSMNSTVHIPAMFFVVVIITILDLGISYFMFHAFRHATASFVTMIMSFTPVFVALIAIPLLNERLSLIQIAGGILIVSAGILTEKLKL